jgi:uncharacterized protein
MSLKQSIQDAVKDAMRARDKVRLITLRMITAGIKQREIDDQVELNDQDVLAILNKMVKQRRDALSQYQDAGRTDLADKEALEITVIQDFLPKQLSEDDVAKAVDAAIADVDAKSMQDMGKLMGVLKPKLDGLADMALVSRLVKAKLS